MKKWMFVIAIVLLLLAMSYSPIKSHVTGRAVYTCENNCPQHCENNIFYFGGTCNNEDICVYRNTTCSFGCIDERGCCGTEEEVCCEDGSCEEGLICNDENICVLSDSRENNQIPETDKSQTMQKTANPEEILPDATDFCKDISCEVYTTQEMCLSGDNVYCCDWDYENTVTRTIPGKGCEGQKTITENEAKCVNKTIQLRKVRQ